MIEYVNIPGKRLRPGMTRYPFSDAVRAGDLFFISGRLGLDPETNKPPESVRDEATLLMNDIVRVLGACGLDTSNLVNVTIFCPDVSLFAEFNEVYLSYFTGDLPARAFIGSGPLLFGCRFEITAIAATKSHRYPASLKAPSGRNGDQ